MSDFATTYGLNPWEGIVDNTKDIYIPDLLDTYRRRSVYQNLINYQIDLRSRNAKVMHFTLMYDLLPDTRELDFRQLWMNPFQTDSESKSVTLRRYGGKVALHDWDAMINQWKKGQISGLRQITRSMLGPQMVDTLDILARNALLEGTYHMFGVDGSKEDFAGLATDGSDDFDPAIASLVWQGAMNRGFNGAVDASAISDGTGSILAITTPGVLASIMSNPDFIELSKYARPQMLMNWEVGTYKGVRFINGGPDHVLWNCGNITFQGEVVEQIKPGAGAARNVDANRVVGQETVPDSGNRYIQVGSTNVFTGNTLVDGTPVGGQENLSASIKPGDMVTVHIFRTNDFGVANGVDYRDGSIVNAKVVSVDDATQRIAVDKPILRDFSADLGGGVYAYVTRADSVHPTVFITGPNPVVGAVASPPTFMNPDSVDDFGRQHRFSWDAYMGYQIWNDHNVEVNFNTAEYRFKHGLRR